jgi:hypothetical protein
MRRFRACAHLHIETLDPHGTRQKTFVLRMKAETSGSKRYITRGLKRKFVCSLKDTNSSLFRKSEQSPDEGGKPVTQQAPKSACSIGHPADKPEYDREFSEDKAAVTIHDFTNRIQRVLCQMCECNEASRKSVDKEQEGILSDLVYELYGAGDICELVRNLVRWNETSRSVAIVALVLMDRVQTSPKGFAVSFENVGKVFAICFLIAKKSVEDFEL